jgi:Na+/melibiose symporter-like transporter
MHCKFITTICISIVVVFATFLNGIFQVKERLLDKVRTAPIVFADSGDHGCVSSRLQYRCVPRLR